MCMSFKIFLLFFQLFSLLQTPFVEPLSQLKRSLLSTTIFTDLPQFPFLFHCIINAYAIFHFLKNRTIFSSFKQADLRCFQMSSTDSKIIFVSLSSSSWNLGPTSWSFNFHVRNIGVNTFLFYFVNFHLMSLTSIWFWVTTSSPEITFMSHTRLKSDLLTRI